MIQTNDPPDSLDSVFEDMSEDEALSTDHLVIASVGCLHSYPGIIGTLMNVSNAHQAAVRAAEEARLQRKSIELPPEPTEENSELTPEVLFWDLLEGWASYHRVDPDLALLVCACATANATGSRRLFEIRNGHPGVSAPTLIGHAEDVGFDLLVKAATAPYLSIQKELEIRYEPLRRKSYRSMQLQRLRYKMGNGGFMFNEFNIRGLYKNLEPEGTVRFVIDGKLPRMAYRALPRCHHYTAMSVGEVEELPRSPRAKEARVDALSLIIEGYDYSKYAIRGFMRFSGEDLEWVLAKLSGLCLCTLPFRSDGTGQPAEHIDVAIAKAGFDQIHRKTARHIMRLRYDDSKFGVDFGDEQVAEYYRQLQDVYLGGCGVVSPMAERTDILSDTIVWYLLHLSAVSGIRIESMEIATRAHETACRLRRRTLEILDQYQAVRHGRVKRKQTLRLVERMERLGVPSTPRDVARGLNKQRMGEIRPLIDFLVEHHVFVRDRGKLRAAPDARDVFDRIPLESFMPVLSDLPFSLTARLERYEQFVSERAAATSITPAPNPTPS